MKRARKPVFFVVAILIFAFTFVSISGLYSYNGDTKTTYFKGIGDIRWGIDINGGVEATFAPDTGSNNATKEQMDAAKSIIETRLVQNNITDYELDVDYNHNRIIVRYPWQNDEQDFNPEEAIKELSATAELTFREGSEYTNTSIDSDGKTVQTDPKGTTASNIFFKGSDVKSAKAGVIQDQNTGETKYVVDLELNDDGAKKFADATKKVANEGSTISIWMDNTMISSASVDKSEYGETGITGGKAQISGNFTAEEATQLANQINSGALPFKLNTTSFSTVNPTLGASSLEVMAIAGIIGFIFVALFMILVFRLPGVVAVISLCGQAALCFAAVSGFFYFVKSFTLTIPGIAGIILSIGMGVDANIITATRIKEEIWAGKSIDHAIKAGDENSFWAIFDGNVTTILVSVILMLVFGPNNILSFIFGASTTGSIYSFGFTLLIGNIGNFVFGVGTTRLMTKSLSAFKPLRKKWLYGGPIHEKSDKGGAAHEAV
jgi:protein-export membrane protein SecD